MKNKENSKKMKIFIVIVFFGIIALIGAMLNQNSIYLPFSFLTFGTIISINIIKPRESFVVNDKINYLDLLLYSIVISIMANLIFKIW